MASKIRPHAKTTHAVVLVAVLGSAAILAATVLMHSVALQSHINRTTHNNNRTADTEVVHCILYDRPPRTGSTTISTALNACLTDKYYARASAMHRSERAGVVTRLCSFKRSHRAAVRSHLSMTQDDVALLRAQCSRLLYVTSISPMWRRLASWSKYSMGSGHGNRTVNTRAVVAALRTKDFAEQERFLEAYPYTDLHANVSEEHRLAPDYVIRADRLIDDTVALLRALGCHHVPTSENVHMDAEQYDDGDSDDDGDEEVQRTLRQVGENMTLIFADRRYLDANRIADENNTRALQMAELF